MSDIICIDCHYVLPQLACAYLIIDNGRAVFVENNTSHAVPLLLSELENRGIPKENVDFVIITHVHLDHAGGSGTLLKACPNAKLLAHPRAAKHVADPSRLIASARQVYGDKFDELYGEILPVPQERIRIMEDGEVFSWQSRKFHFLYTRGHANHHFCIYDSGSNGIFTGDSFGIAYPRLSPNQEFIFPTTTPTDFDPEEAILSLEKIVNTGAEIAYLTHFGGVKNLKEKQKLLEEGLHYFRNCILEASEKNWDANELQLYMEDKIRTYFYSVGEKMGLSWDAEQKKFLEFDVVLNAQGLAFYLMKQKKKSN